MICDLKKIILQLAVGAKIMIFSSVGNLELKSIRISTIRNNIHKSFYAIIAFWKELSKIYHRQ